MTIEEIICNYLGSVLDCPVLPERPERPFGRMVFIERIIPCLQVMRKKVIYYCAKG